MQILEEANHVPCFNHVLQLSAKVLLRPFIPVLGKAPNIDSNGGQDDFGIEDEDDFGEEDNRPDVLNIYDVDDDILNRLDKLHEYSCEELIKDAVIVRVVFSELHQLSLSITRSTTITLPVWRCYCMDLGLKPRILPRDVTRWNSTFDMLSFALEYRAAIDAITADKT